MPAGLAFMDRQKLALVGAKFRAWWNGADFDEAAALAEIDAAAAAAPEPPSAGDAKAVEAALFEAPVDPRLQALQIIWGDGRIAPGDAADEAHSLQRLQIGEGAALAFLSPGLAGSVAAFAAPGRTLSIFEWRSETRPALAAGAESVGVSKIEPFDMDVTPLPHDAFDGLISFDDLTYGYAPHLALQMAKAVKPGARAIVDCYVGPQGPDLAQAFASAFAEPQIRTRNELEHAVSEAGFDIEAEDDLTEAHLALARARFEALPTLMSGADAPKLAPGAARELAWETETWRVRLRMLSRRRLERRRMVLRRRP